MLSPLLILPYILCVFFIILEIRCYTTKVAFQKPVTFIFLHIATLTQLLEFCQNLRFKCLLSVYVHCWSLMVLLSWIHRGIFHILNLLKLYHFQYAVFLNALSGCLNIYTENGSLFVQNDILTALLVTYIW